MKKTKTKTVRVQRGESAGRCPQLRGAFLAVQHAPRMWRLVIGGMVGLVLVVAAYSGVQWLRVGVHVETGGEAERELVPVVSRHPFTGEVVESGERLMPRVMAVMIENSADAWPLSGVEDAFLAIEAPAEADIPRFIAFYYDGQPEVKKIGPVRSARRYYLDWAAEYAPLYAHVGGSPEALEALATLPTITNFDEFYNGSFFWRATDRYAPHNAYTSTDLLKSGLEAKGVKSMTDFAPWKFEERQASGEGQVKVIDIDWAAGSTYDFSWRMTDDGHYVRYRGEQPVLSGDGDRYQVENVITLQTDIEVIDEKARKSLRTLGEGPARVFVAGREIEARWEKKTASDRLRFYEAESGAEVTLAPGKTWIGVLPVGGSVHAR